MPINFGRFKYFRHQGQYNERYTVLADIKAMSGIVNIQTLW